MGLLDWVQVNVFEVVSCEFRDDGTIFPQLTVRTMLELSRVEKHIKRINIKIEDLP